ncbi:TetR/AcrR family transcriptional regulator [Brochothrix campestris]|uniref:TetR family transcriptional regulator n=1 Tax=Brochothrix campestris FSL F6-1037 TaxID=1265861 RepID=W7D8D2_9LIST|nr:TetR/AcrR family transcriptional regulator [Brochothrix campestris]EUJ41708.1 TetR family transcriptional regulator [Brochothrix campestris FSL F6-1037]
MKITTADIYRESKMVLLESGYDGLTFAELGKRLGVTRPALYKHFTNKDEMITALMVSEMLQISEQLPTDMSASFERLFENLLTVLISFSELHRMMSSLYRIEYEQATSIGDNLDQLKQQHRRFSATVDAIITKGKHIGVFDTGLSTELITQFIMGIIETVDLKSASKEEWLTMLTQLVLYGTSKRT